MIGFGFGRIVVQHICTSVCACWDESTVKYGFIKNLPPSTWCIIKTVPRFLKPSANIRRIPVFRWNLANGITGFVLGFTLEKCGLKIHVIKVPP